MSADCIGTGCAKESLLARVRELEAERDALRAALRDAVSKMRMVENHVCPPDEWDETVEAIDAALKESP